MTSSSDKKPIQFNNINELNKYTDVKVNIKNVLQCKQYCNSSNDIFKKAEVLFKSGDEENAYILFMRYFYIVKSIKTTYEYNKAKGQFDPLLPHNNLKIAVLNAEKLQKSLCDRYSKKEEATRAEQLARQLSNKVNHKEKDFDDLHLILPDVPDENTIPKKSQPHINNKNSNIDHQDTTGEENKENVNRSNKHVSSISLPAAGYISVDSLYELFKINKSTPELILLIDIRTAEEFGQAKISHSCMINIPESLLQAGANINSIERKLNNDTWKVWNTRINKKYLVIVDYDFDDETASATCAAYTLQNVLCKFNAPYKVDILTGGFKEWHLHYPSLTTNPTYSKQPGYASIINPLSLIHNLTYPELSTKKTESVPPVETNKPIDVNNQPTMTNKPETIQPNPEKRPMQMDKLAQLREMLEEKDDKQAGDVMGLPASNPLSLQSHENNLPKENVANSLEEKKHTNSSNRNFGHDVVNNKPTATVEKDTNNELSTTETLMKPNGNIDQLDSVPVVGTNHFSKRSQPNLPATSNDVELSSVVSPVTAASQLITTVSSTPTTITNPATGKRPPDVMLPGSELPSGPKKLLTNENTLTVSSVPQTVLPVNTIENNPEQLVSDKSNTSIVKSTHHPQPENISNNKQKANIPKLENESLTLPKVIPSSNEPGTAKPNEDELPGGHVTRSPKTQRNAKTKPKAADKNQVKQAPEFVTTFGLPHGWEKAIHHDTGRIYFKDHNTRTTHWELPAEIKAKLMRNETPSSEQESGLPEQRVDAVDSEKSKPTLKRSFSSPNLAEVVDKESKKTNWTRPVIDRSNKPKEEKKVFADRSTKPISRTRLQNLSPVQGGKGRCLTGLKNLGNSCYMNSVLQCLSNTIPLAKYFYSSKFELDLNKRNMNPRPTEMARELAFILGVLSIGQYGSVSPIDFKLALGRFSSQFRGTEQQDGHELLMYLLDGLHEDVNRVKTRQKLKEREDDDLPDSVAADLSWRDYKLNNDSVIVDLFQGQFRSTVVCLSCNKKSKTFDAFNCLQLELPPNRSTSLEECIKSFTKPERIGGNDSWKCPHCKCYRTAEKTIDIWKLPKILIVQLKRFRFDGRWRNKIQTNINFPVRPLDLARYVANGSTTQYTKFQLYSVINHYGSFESGHYTAYCENAINSQWYSFDDNFVKDMDRNAIKTNAAYLLFYTAIDFKSSLKK